MAQSLDFASRTMDTVSGDFFTELEAKATVENISAQTNSYLVLRTELNMTPGHTSYYCWSIDCYPPNVDLSTSNITLSPGQKDSTFVAYLTPYDGTGGFAGTSVVRYRFFNENDAADSISAVFVYTATGTSSISTRILDKNDFYAYPNPTTDMLNVAFGEIDGYRSGKIVIRNALGSEMIAKPINLSRNMANLDVSTLDRGVYFYTIQLDGKNIHTKKFVVSK